MPIDLLFCHRTIFKPPRQVQSRLMIPDSGSLQQHSWITIMPYSLSSFQVLELLSNNSGIFPELLVQFVPIKNLPRVFCLIFCLLRFLHVIVYVTISHVRYFSLTRVLSTIHFLTQIHSQFNCQVTKKEYFKNEDLSFQK